MSIDFRKQGEDVAANVLESEVEAPTNRTIDVRALDSTDNEKQWQTLWDRLIDWNLEPSHVDEDELESPSRAAIRRGSNLLIQFKHQNPREIPILAPDGEGGISIEYHLPQKVLLLFEVDRNGEAEFMKLVDSKMKIRTPI